MSHDHLTYCHRGATRADDLLTHPPRGYRPIERRVPIGRGRDTYAEAVRAVLSWQVQQRSGIRVDAPRERQLRTGDVARLRIGRWPWDAPCQVVYTIAEPTRAGFAYGTLRGHPERGEELFLVELDGDENVWLRIRAFSRPANWVLWLGYPVLRLMQGVYTRRYERSLLDRADR
ncbi:DUF1990 family protein [Ruania halotolerans]|uniref:DUF1990 family protein n=1 Tax=Ruania halotolerans TaxID=2897773 RepID=UPI001E509FF8|nr:DUF1990 domain-containing protein [Ruania halotolerans]UFU06220.1 DUF1990 domain-containing protein [Ruania halotolerans]